MIYRSLFIGITAVMIGFQLSAQRLNTPTLSPASKIVQEVALSEVTLEYARPSAKGRVVFGDLVPYNVIWRTGANASTKITISEEVKIGGKDVAAGTYALYTIPSQQEWTIIVHTNTKMRSIDGRYKEADDLFRFNVKSSKTNEYFETFTIQFEDLKTNSCNLALMWENTKIRIPIEFDVDSRIEEQMAEFLKSPDEVPHRTLFEAAQYYLHNDKDLATAVDWIDQAMMKSENNARYGLLKSKILFKAGKKDEALKVIDMAYKWAEDTNNQNYMGQTSLFKKEILRND